MHVTINQNTCRGLNLLHFNEKKFRPTHMEAAGRRDDTKPKPTVHPFFGIFLEFFFLIKVTLWGHFLVEIHFSA